MNNLKIAITGWGGISPLGVDSETVWDKYQDNQHYCNKIELPCGIEWCAPLSEEAKAKILDISSERLQYKQLDRSVLYAMAASRIAIEQAGWGEDAEFGINIGSSRGATGTFEKYHTQFIESGKRFVNPLTSPTTTLGNIASWVAADLGAKGPVISHSITCSTALHSMANAIVWLKSGFCSRFLAGGSEAPLTAFTIAQMKAIKIYSSLDDKYPCRSMDLSKLHNTMILGEGAASFCLELKSSHSLAHITGLGYGTEKISNGVSLSVDALCLQKSMQMALKGHDLESVDVIVLHSPGTIQGDNFEMNAINAVFSQSKPLLTSNKWKIGHTFGASGALSMEMALLMLKYNQFIQPPYLPHQYSNRPLKKILINAVGFGGNAVSILIEK
ncbi:beta-ketoacyl synthase N-terminal-like domain-containing protein [Mucilaginibacter puniceus]